MAKAMGHHVMVISSSDKKRTEAIKHLGADEYLVSSDEAALAGAFDSLDYIIDTFVSPMVMLGRKTISGSFLGSIEETQEKCEKRGLTSMIEMVKMEGVNEALERLERNDVRYQFVINVAGSKLDDD